MHRRCPDAPPLASRLGLHHARPAPPRALVHCLSRRLVPVRLAYRARRVRRVVRVWAACRQMKMRLVAGGAPHLRGRASPALPSGPDAAWRRVSATSTMCSPLPALASLPLANRCQCSTPLSVSVLIPVRGSAHACLHAVTAPGQYTPRLFTHGSPHLPFMHAEYLARAPVCGQSALACKAGRRGGGAAACMNWKVTNCPRVALPRTHTHQMGYTMDGGMPLRRGGATRAPHTHMTRLEGVRVRRRARRPPSLPLVARGAAPETRSTSGPARAIAAGTGRRHPGGASAATRCLSADLLQRQHPDPFARTPTRAWWRSWVRSGLVGRLCGRGGRPLLEAQTIKRGKLRAHHAVSASIPLTRPRYSGY